MHIEQKLQIPNEWNQYTEDRISQREWVFLDQKLVAVNASWVCEFYANYYTGSLNTVHLRGKKILVTKELIKRILHFLPKTIDKDA
ncbi:hypothetical protein AHAS_Ahas13G0362900 [Arachis hypogaea]